MSNGRYGEYGGQYISETLMNELQSLNVALNNLLTSIDEVSKTINDIKEISEDIND